MSKSSKSISPDLSYFSLFFESSQKDLEPLKQGSHHTPQGGRAAERMEYASEIFWKIGLASGDAFLAPRTLSR